MDLQKKILHTLNREGTNMHTEEIEAKIWNNHSQEEKERNKRLKEITKELTTLKQTNKIQQVKQQVWKKNNL